MFAKFSPDGSRVAYVREHDLYAESLADGHITPLTHDGSVTTINGTFDWVYEEELDDRDGFRWSPDGKRIAYWQLDAKGVRDFLLIDNTDSLYSFVKPVQYPKAGTTNSAARIGVVSADGGPTKWLEIPGDPRNNYLARMDWEPGTNDVLVQQLNRRQTQNTFYVANATTGGAKPLFVDRDSAWIDVYSDATGPSVDWLADNSGFVFLSERDGWRHAYLVSKTGAMRLITPGEFDAMKIEYVDTKGGWLYYDASPDERDADVSLAREARRIGPSGAVDAGGGARHALVRHRSRRALGDSQLFDIRHAAGDGPGTAAESRVARTLESNADVAARIAALRRGAVAFFADRHRRRGQARRMDDEARRFRFDKEISGAVLRVRRARVADCARCIRRQHVPVAPDAHAARLHRGERRQSRHAGPARTRVAQGRAQPDRIASCARAVVRCESRRPAAVRRLDPSRGVGLERRRVVDPAPHVPRARRLSRRHGGRAGGQLHNYDTIYQERYVGLPSTDEAATTTRHRSTMPTAYAATCSSFTDRATTTCTIRAPSN